MGGADLVGLVSFVPFIVLITVREWVLYGRRSSGGACRSVFFKKKIWHYSRFVAAYCMGGADLVGLVSFCFFFFPLFMLRFVVGLCVCGGWT